MPSGGLMSQEWVHSGLPPRGGGPPQPSQQSSEEPPLGLRAESSGREALKGAVWPPTLSSSLCDSLYVGHGLMLPKILPVLSPTWLTANLT